MKTEKLIGLLLLVGAVLVLFPYTLLTIIFQYPDILREDAGVVLTQFHAGGARLIWVWWVFGMSSTPLLWAFVLIGQLLEVKARMVRWATTLGVIAVMAQIIGLLRWTFVVPVLAETYVNAQTETTREAAKVVFMAVHQFGGVVLGEHIGQLFTICWAVLLAAAFRQMQLFPRWVSWFGYAASGIYVLAQAELFATVLPGFPVWGPAGLIGSMLLLAWLMIMGTRFWIIKTGPAGDHRF